MLKTLFNLFVTQFALPRGIFGSLAGSIMLHRKSNIERNRKGVALLGLRPGMDVLEIGCGPGTALPWIQEELQAGSLLAMDHSSLMIRTVMRNIKKRAEIRFEAITADIESLEFESQSFDRIYSSNAVQFWKNRPAVYAKLYAALRPGGLIVTNFMARHPGATSMDSHRFIERLKGEIGQVPFSSHEIRCIESGRVDSCCLISAR